MQVNFEQETVGERTVIDVTEKICEIMNRQNLSAADLAARLKTTRKNVNRILADDDSSLDIRTISNLLFALGYRLDVRVVALRPK